MRKQANPECWEQILSEQISSGLTQIKWCEQNSINIHKFRYWKRRLSLNPSAEADPNEGKWALIAPKAKSIPNNSHGESCIQIQIGQATVTVTEQVNFDTLSDVISLLMKYVQ